MVKKSLLTMKFTKPTTKEWMSAVEWASKAPDDLNNMRPIYRPQSFPELLDTFPEAVPSAKRAAKAKIKELNKAISGLSDFRELWNTDIQKIHFSKQPAYIAYLDDLIERLQTGYEKEIRKQQYDLNYIEQLKNPEKKPKGDAVTSEMIERAKKYPIRELLEVKRGVSLCLWHDDHKPSMKIYDKQNCVYCFACGHRGDVIDVYMALNGCDFRTAVRKLCV